MSNINFYFGAYLEVKTKPITETIPYTGCASGHRFDTAFCPKCGLPCELFSEKVSKTASHTWHIDGYDELHKNELIEIVPPSLRGSGTIILRTKMSFSKDHWLYLYGIEFVEEVEEDTKPFPTDAEVAQMKQALQESCQDIIDFLNAHPLVTSVEVKAGYVLDAEY